jgi:uncharacterized protein (DUF362 family)
MLTTKERPLISPSLYQCWTAVEIEQVVEMILEHHKAILPIAQNALILLKPNLNSDMIGLTGNTTDLRIIASVVRGLQKRGYGNITVADGTSSGFLNADIDGVAKYGRANEFSPGRFEQNFRPRNRAVEWCQSQSRSDLSRC